MRRFAASLNSLGQARLLRSMTLWNDARLTRRALARLSDRELNDIGLTRYDIDGIGR